ncbi:MAG: deoxyribodipyrimidine photo-lyase type I [Candidatus Nitrotoga sp. CP45]|nr:MAG: deoxyribodipyrimidine photo-lyase type I [Candidatus Nitrotoga sp. CP45]
MPRYDKSLIWFRRDLRCDDHAALHYALKESRLVFCAFIFDKQILDPLLVCGARADRRVEFIHASLQSLDDELKRRGGALIVRHADAVAVIPELAQELGIDAVFVNHDYEPQAITRDNTVEKHLNSDGRAWHSYKDQVIFEKDEVLSLAGKPFSVFTPYKNTWLKKLQSTTGLFDLSCLALHDTKTGQGKLASPAKLSPIPSLAAMGFETTNLSKLNITPGMQGAQTLLDDFLPRMKNYRDARDFPAVKGPSYLSVHLRFGTISIRALARHAIQAIASGQCGDGAMTWLSELVWRDFYFMILYQHPYVVQRAFKPEYDRIQWESGPAADAAFTAWCEGRTGYPLVDAAMLQLNQTGYMHNRLRMVTASFLTKDLGIDWRRGEQYFALKLNDFDLAANNGGWQWAASSGCDAQPYFRIFNPVTQSEKFDAEGKFIRRYLPQLAKLDAKRIHTPWLLPETERIKAGITLGENYPAPIAMHDQARLKTLDRYAVVKK